MATTINLNHPAHYVHWHLLQISEVYSSGERETIAPAPASSRVSPDTANDGSAQL
jgi:hypothetical protein